MSTDLKNCQFLLETGATHQLSELLDSRALDIVVAGDMGDKSTDMEVYPLLVEPFVAAVPKGRISGDDIAKQLRRMPLIRYTTRHHMGRMIKSHLDQEGVNTTQRFELDSYHAIMAMVADGAGWSILTPLGWMRAGRFRDQVDLIELPFAPLTRTITLRARKDVLSTMPATMAERLRPLLQAMIVEPGVAAHPWLREKLRLV